MPGGQMGNSDGNSEGNRNAFQVRQHTAKVRTAMPVEVMKVYPGDKPHEFKVDVKPMVNQQDGGGKNQDHGTIYGIPVSSGSGGNGAAVVKPLKGDMGFMNIGDRDHSSALKDKKSANPGSRRSHSPSDGVYYGGMHDINDAKQWVVIEGEEGGKNLKITINTPGAVNITCATFTLNASGKVSINGNPVDINN